MTGEDLRLARESHGWTQQLAAQRLGVTQAYLSMLERGKRPVTPAVVHRAAEQLGVRATALPLVGTLSDSFEEALGALGYPGFAYLRDGRRYNPAELLLLALDSDNLPTRAVEGLPWLPLAFPDLDWEWLLREAKLRNRQNRLGFILILSGEAAMQLNNQATATLLAAKVKSLVRSRLAAEDTLCQAAMTHAERVWLKTHSTSAAREWNLLSDLRLSDLNHAHV